MLRFREPLHMGPVQAEAYIALIQHHFKAVRRRIDAALVNEGLVWCRCHTYYVHYLFNRLYALNKQQVDTLSTVRQALGVRQEKELVHQAAVGCRVTDVLLGHQLAG